MKSDTAPDEAFVLNPGSFVLNKRTRLENRVVLGILLIVGLFTTADIISDLGEGATLAHLSGEGIVALCSFAGVVILWRRTMNLRREVITQKRAARRAEAGREDALNEAQRWREQAATALRGLSDAIDLQLTKWGLTTAEKEVALLLLKGLSLKEVATVRDVSEKTARAQSFSIYAKSGLAGRAELSAFFLEDLMVRES